ncbi:MAG: sigma 54-interacting transcriptional regulator [Micropepsaceae bacterium]
MNLGTVIVADDDASIRTVLNHALARAGFLVRTTGNAATLWRWASAGEGDIIITDVVMPDENAFELLPKLKKLRPDLPVIVMSAQNTLMTAINATECGAYEYLPKPFDLNEMVGVVKRAIKSKAPVKQERDREGGSVELPMVGRSPAMQEIYRIIARLTQSDLTVLITGESGTGKELVARALHDFGKRSAGPFVVAGASALTHEGAERELMKQAEGGTLFLDEIGDWPLDVQTRMVRVLQEVDARLSSTKSSNKESVRVIACTHRDLRRLIDLGTFREDLYFRFNVVPVRLPPLRERPEDIPELVQHFLVQGERQGQALRSIDPAALDILKRQPWPGNVRELENLIQRLLAIHAEPVITGQMVSSMLHEPKPSSPPRRSDEESVSLGAFVETYLSEQFAKLSGQLPESGLHDRVLREVERPLIIKCLSLTRGNQIKAAEILGVNRNTLRAKIRSLDIPLQRG